MSIWDNWKHKKPEWEADYEFFEEVIAKQTGLNKHKLREVIELMKEYKILSKEG